jgi:hypothetical protein
VLNSDDRRRTEDLAIGDHRRRLFQREPPDGPSLVPIGRAHLVGSPGKVQLLLAIGRSDDRLERHHVLDRTRLVPGLLDDLAGSGYNAILRRHTSRMRASASSRTTVIAHFRIRMTYCSNMVPSGSSTDATLSRICGFSSTRRSPWMVHRVRPISLATLAAGVHDERIVATEFEPWLRTRRP